MEIAWPGELAVYQMFPAPLAIDLYAGAAFGKVTKELFKLISFSTQGVSLQDSGNLLRIAI
jgi:hypothetical protein